MDISAKKYKTFLYILLTYSLTYYVSLLLHLLQETHTLELIFVILAEASRTEYLI